LENILLPLYDTSKENRARALALKQTLQLNVPANRKPAGLPVGQRQLAAVARVLINNPAAIFADEPTASPDMDTALAVMDTSSRLPKPLPLSLPPMM
jgi:ABC-type lipoprotein export system ATPase subunit